MIKPEILPYPEVPSEDKAQKLVVFLHGYGSDGNDLISLTPFFNIKLNHAHYISPHGVEPCEMAPYGRQWFSLNDRSPEVVKERAGENAKHIMSIIKEKQMELHLTNKDTILIGFSQGTMMGAYLTLIQDEPFAALVAYSGRLIPPPEVKNKNTPICIVHGMDDDLVRMEESEYMAEFLDKEGVTNEVKMIKNLHHSIDAAGIKFATEFLNKHIKS